MPEKTYLAIDLKSFYASVECRERGLDPLHTHLVVADESRTDKTVCLAVTPPLKAYGLSGRSRLFEVRQKIREVNAARKSCAPGRRLTGSSWIDAELREHPELAVDFLIAPPRMAYYMEYSTRVYQVYLKYAAPEDILVYSIDEVFIDVTEYLHLYRLTPRELAMKIILDVLSATGITATAGIGTNLYLCKVAMDLMAKHMPADENGVRIAALDEESYRRNLWSHRPLTDFWRVGPGLAGKLEVYGIFTMGDIARCSAVHEELLYRLFGKNAELLIDHAWGWEPCSMADVKAFRPETNSLGSGQILHQPYDAEKTRIVLREMADSLALALVDKGLVTDQLVVTIGYDVSNLTAPERRNNYQGEVIRDRYGRNIPKYSRGTQHLPRHTSSSVLLTEGALQLFDRIIRKELLVRRLNITAEHVVNEADAPAKEPACEQLDMFTDYEAVQEEKREEEARLARERRMQETMLSIKKKYGKNAILKGTNLQEGATAKDRNEQIGGHKA